MVDIRHNHLRRNTIPFLQNRMSQDLTDKLIKLQPKITMLEDKRPLNLECCFSEISSLMTMDSEEINSKKVETNIRKVCGNIQNVLHFF